MKHRAAVAVFVAVASLALVGQVANHPGQTPAGVRATPLNPSQIEYGRAGEAAARVLAANGCPTTYAVPIGRAAVNNRISPRVFAALVYVESSCRPDAVSDRGAVGLSQINVAVWHVSRRQALDPDYNLDKGAEILAQYVRARGLREGLHRFNGLGDNSSQYSIKVLVAAYRR
jgi:soluble lytic murein transglycosylase-like protein